MHISRRIKCAACGGDENDGKICPVSTAMHISRRSIHGSTRTQVVREQERQEALERSKARLTQPVVAFTGMSQQPASVHAPPPAVPPVFAFPGMPRQPASVHAPLPAGPPVFAFPSMSRQPALEAEECGQASCRRPLDDHRFKLCSICREMKARHNREKRKRLSGQQPVPGMVYLLCMMYMPASCLPLHLTLYPTHVP